LEELRRFEEDLSSETEEECCDELEETVASICVLLSIPTLFMCLVRSCSHLTDETFGLGKI
jgi:hypothetical protein